MSSSRWDPWGDIISLREAMTNLLEESFVRPRSPGASPPGGLGLAVDLLETPEAFVLTASVPGVRPGDVAISILGDTITIAGRRQETHNPHHDSDGSRWLIRERHFGNFDRDVRLPSPVDADVATADFEDGVLTITLPKTAEAKPRTIAVRSTGNASESPEIAVETSLALESDGTKPSSDRNR
jgi:HSP20 family protein